MRSYLILFFVSFVKMPKVLKPKIYKAVKKNLDGKDFICVQIKNLKTQQVRDLKRDVNNLTEGWFEPKNEDSESSLLLKFPNEVMTPVY